ncbi:MAG: alpha/beta hydrolase [Anaerolineae bacterium]|jgi:pimeloyl-ACP methyl ester carboxylesterase|nr:alpha/beta hydrolase [Anaerolineae bacterium]MBT7074129.1 alpha/beta hydrolase [Anaerolineae bacterium]MBT7781342.1 alpha/beta hydrolase [Anaerolineae bacterium]
MPTAASLYYFCHEAKAPTNTPIILIHGAGGSHLHYPPELRRLNGFQVAALDLPGHGKSDGLGKQSINEYVKSIQDFMDAINLPAAVIIGHSMGSAIALQLALNTPDRVLGLILLGSGSRLRVAPSVLEESATEATFPLAVKRLVEWSFSAETSSRLKELATQRMSETRPTVLHGDFMACDSFDISENVSEIKSRTLILCGTEDKMTPIKYSQALHGEIPNSELELIEGAGHMLALEKPREVAEIIERFVEKI